jgi:hypothetical protein
VLSSFAIPQQQPHAREQHRLRKTVTWLLHLLRCNQTAPGQFPPECLPLIIWSLLAVAVAVFVTLVAVEQVGY